MAARQASKVDDWKDVDLTKDRGQTGVGVLDTIGDVASGLNPLPAIGQTLAHPIDTAKGLVQAQGEQFSKARQDISNRDIPAALSHAAGGLIPLVGPFLSNAWDLAQTALEGNDPHTAIREAASTASPLLVPPAVRGIGKAMTSAAPTLAETALGIRGQTHHYGATPGKAILEETEGVRPASVQESAQARLGELNDELEGLAKQSKNTGSLEPARRVLDIRSATAAHGNSAQTPAEMGKMRKSLTEPRPGFTGPTEFPRGAVHPVSFQQQPTPLVGPNGQPMMKTTAVRGPAPEPVLSADQPARDLLQIKREFGKDFTRWNPLNPSGEMGTARSAYGALADEFNRAVPGAAPLNQKISSLIPVAERSNLVQHNATLGQRALGRIGAHTGALAGALGGYATHGLPGMAAGLVIPEFLSDPTVQMIGARSLSAAGKATQGGLVPALGQGAAMAPKKKVDDWEDVSQ